MGNKFLVNMDSCEYVCAVIKYIPLYLFLPSIKIGSLTSIQEQYKATVETKVNSYISIEWRVRGCIRYDVVVVVVVILEFN